jgi:hypothetical protein
MIDVAIAEGVRADDECRGVRIPRRGALEQLMQAYAAVVVDPRVVPDVEQDAILRRRSHRQITSRFSFVGQDAVQHLDELFMNPLDRDMIE